MHVLRSQADVEIGALLTTINEPAQRVAMHAVRIELLEAQADALGLPLWKIPIPSPCPNETYERAMAAAVARAVAEGFTHVAFGDLFLEDVRRYREERLAGTGTDADLSAVWRRHRGACARDGRRRAWPRASRASIRPCSIAGSPAGTSMPRCWPICRRTVDPCGERGEFHTCAYRGPMFSHEIPIETGVTVERDGFVFTDLTIHASPQITPIHQ